VINSGKLEFVNHHLLQYDWNIT